MGSYTGTVPTFLSGELPDSTKFDEITSFMTAATAAWTVANPAPTWTASAGTPAIGNGTLVGRYRQLGKTKDFTIVLTAGTTTTFGTAGAFWQFTIPGGGTAASRTAGSAWVLDTGTLEYPLIWTIGYGGLTVIELFKPGSGRHTNTSPFTFGNTDVLVIGGTIELV